MLFQLSIYKADEKRGRRLVELIGEVGWLGVIAINTPYSDCIMDPLNDTKTSVGHRQLAH